MQESRPVHIYILREQSIDEARYVGQTVNIKSRYRAHVRINPNKNEVNLRKTKWIKEVIKKGKEIQLVVIETCSEDNANDRENYWIQYYLSNGHRLTNGIDVNTGKRIAGRNPLPEDKKKKPKHAFLHQKLIDWLTEKGNGNFSTGIEIASKLAGYKETTDNQKEGTAGRRPRRTNLEPSTCAAALI